MPKPNPTRRATVGTLCDVPERFAHMVDVTYGSLTVVGFSGRRDRKGIMLACECQCGLFVDVVPNKLISGNTTSCGCAHRKFMTKHNESLITHGHARGGTVTPEYRAWTAMIRRCHDPEDEAFSLYGAKDIFVCEEWRASFEAFFAYIGSKPSRLHSLDRIDTTGGYAPGNVRWATATEQVRNRRTTMKYTLDGISKPLGEWADQFEADLDLVAARVRSGWTLANALTLRVGDRPDRDQAKSAADQLRGVWYAIVHRCEDPTHPRYADYGGRGIRVCPQWRDSFEEFSRCVGERPSLAHTIDRIDNNKGYEPLNVRWATYETQSRNRRNVRLLEFGGDTKSLPEWADIAGIPLYMLRRRLKNGWSVDEALGTPAGGMGRVADKDKVKFDWPRK